MVEESRTNETTAGGRPEEIEILLAERHHAWEKLQRADAKVIHYLIFLSLLITMTTVLGLMFAEKMVELFGVESPPIQAYSFAVFGFSLVCILICFLICLEKALSVSRPFAISIKRLEYRVKGPPFPIHPADFSIGREEIMEAVRSYESAANSMNKVFIETGNVLYASLAFFVSGVAFSVLAYFLCNWPALTIFLTCRTVVIISIVAVLLTGVLYYMSKEKTSRDDVLHLVTQANDVRPSDVH